VLLRYAVLGKITVFTVEIAMPTAFFRDAIISLIELNEVENCYIRPIAFTAYGEMGLNPIKK